MSGDLIDQDRDLPYALGEEADPPLNKAALTKAVAAPVLMGVRSIVRGHPASHLTPERLATILRAAEYGDAIAYHELAEQMEELDPHYRSVLGTRKFAVTQLKMTVEPASDSADDKRNAALVSDWCKRDELEEELFDVLDAIGKGWSLVEIIWEITASRWVPKLLEWRDQRWFIMDRINGKTPLLRDMAGFLPLDPYKFIYHISKSKSGLPTQGGLAVVVAWCWMFKNYALKDWTAFAEVFGMPLRVGKYEVGETEENITRLMSAVANMGSDAAAVIAKSMDIEFIETGKGAGSPGETYRSLCDFLDQQISKAVLGQTATTDAIAGGHAVGKTHNEVRGDLKRADAKQLQATLNRDLVRPMIDLNYGAPKDGNYPRLIIEQEDDPLEVGALANALEILVPMGLKVRMGDIMQRLGLTEADDDDEVLQAPAAAPAPDPNAEIDPKTGKPLPPAPAANDDPAPPKPVGPSEGQEAQGADVDDAASARLALAAALGAPSVASRAWTGLLRLLQPLKRPSEPARASADVTPAHVDAIDHALDDALGDWQPLVDPLVQPLERLVANAASLEALRDQLAGAVGAMSVDEIAQLLAESTFTARLAGVTGHSLAQKSET